MLFTAAHNPAGKAALIRELAAGGTWRLMTSVYAVAEARHNLAPEFDALAGLVPMEALPHK